MPSSPELDNDVRLHVYQEFVEAGRPPSASETADALGVAVEDAEAAYGRLEEARVVVLAPGTLTIWMANPLSAVPTPFRAETERGSYWGNCAWDGLGVIAMLGGDGRLAASCGDCGEPLEFRVRGGELEPVDAVVHYVVPARRWWENIAFT